LLQREDRIGKLRAEAMKEIWAERGFEGVTRLLSYSRAPHTVGQYAAAVVTDFKASADFLRQCLSIKGDLQRKADGCIHGFFMSRSAETRGPVLTALTRSGDGDEIVRLFRCAPFGQDTWRLLDRYSNELRERYWREVVPYWNRHSEAELT